MLIGYDASRAFVSEHTGTENYSLNLLRALAKVDHKNQYRVYLRDFSTPSLRNHEVAKQSRQKIATRSSPRLEEILSLRRVRLDFAQNDKRGGARNDKVGQGWPSNFEFVNVSPNRLWTQLGLGLETWKNPVDLLFVPAHTLPVLRRRKILKFQFPNSKLQTNTNVRNSKLQKFLNLDIFNLNIVWNLLFVIWNFLSKETKYVVTIHDLGVEYLPGYHQFPQRYYLDFASKYAAKSADAVIAVSAATKADLVKRYGVNGNKVFVVHEGVDTAFFRPSSKLPAKGEPRPNGRVQSIKSKYKIKGDYVLFVGTVQPRKNLAMLIEAFAKATGQLGNWATRTAKRNQPISLIANKPNCQLVIAGKLGWDYTAILAAPKKFGVESKVKFLGHVDTNDLPALYSGARVFTFPSLFEGFGLPILEAISCGSRVIASDIPPHREVYSVLKSQNSELFKAMILVKPNDVGRWTDVLYQSISQYEKTKSNISINGQILAKFSWEEAAKKTLEVFEQVLQ